MLHKPHGLSLRQHQKPKRLSQATLDYLTELGLVSK